jgi:hypothetical protein
VARRAVSIEKTPARFMKNDRNNVHLRKLAALDFMQLLMLPI